MGPVVEASARLHKVPMIATHHAKRWRYKAEDKSLPLKSSNGKWFAKSSDFKKQTLADLALVLTHESLG